MHIAGKKIGIWGYGIVGKAVYAFLQKHNCTLAVMDKNTSILSDLPTTVTTYTQENIQSFFEQNEYLLVSPGIDIRTLYPTYKHKIITELDIFYTYFHKPIIAITGTVGKTSVTACISHALNAYNIPHCTGGNIGRGSCDLINSQNNSDYAVLEVSDVQLKYCTHFAPQLAIWTTFAPNHLDWHNTIEDYFNAKCNIFLHQKVGSQLLAPLELLPRIKPRLSTNHEVCWFTAQKLESTYAYKTCDPVYYLDQYYLRLRTTTSDNIICTRTSLPSGMLQENMLIVCAALHMLKLPLEVFLNTAHTFTLPEHRCEHVATLNNGISFFNDSKSTTPFSTHAALKSLHGKPIRLFLGGLSKGINRSTFIQELVGKVVKIYCFGKEAPQLYTFCTTYNIRASEHINLENAFDQCIQEMNTHDQILFSPAGSSFDLFSNFAERGKRFKELVHKYAANI